MVGDSKNQRFLVKGIEIIKKIFMTREEIIKKIIRLVKKEGLGNSDNYTEKTDIFLEMDSLDRNVFFTCLENEFCLAYLTLPKDLRTIDEIADAISISLLSEIN